MSKVSRRKATSHKRAQPPRPKKSRSKLLNPRDYADLGRQAKLLAKHPENDAIDAWIEANYDWSEWR